MVEADGALGGTDQQHSGAVDQGAGAGRCAGAGAGRGGPQQRVEHSWVAVGVLLEIQQDLQQLAPQLPGGGGAGRGEHPGERTAHRRWNGAVPQQPGHQGQQQRAGGGAVLQPAVDVRGGVHGVVGVAVDVRPYEPGGVQGQRGGVDPGERAQHLARLVVGPGEPLPQRGEHRLRMGGQRDREGLGGQPRLARDEGPQRLWEVAVPGLRILYEEGERRPVQGGVKRAGQQGERGPAQQLVVGIEGGVCGGDQRVRGCGGPAGAPVLVAGPAVDGPAQRGGLVLGQRGEQFPGPGWAVETRASVRSSTARSRRA